MPKKHIIDLEEANKWKSKYDEINDKITRLFGQWDYATIILKQLDWENPLLKRVFLDIEHIKEQISFFQKLKEEYWKEYWKNKFGEDYGTQNENNEKIC